MKYKQYMILSIVILILTVGLTNAQARDCPVILDDALRQTNDVCAETSRNEACYGHQAVIATSQPDVEDFKFDEIGDRESVAKIGSLQIGHSMTQQTSVWGVILMRLQANLPNTVPGQSITLLMFGDVEVENVAQSVEQQRMAQLPIIVRTLAGANIRTEPSAEAELINAASPGFQTIAVGRSLDSQWVNIELPDNESGWVFAELVQIEGDISELGVTEGLSELTYAPMQAFYMRTGIGEGNCSDLGSGTLIQSSDFIDDDGQQIDVPTANGGITVNINDTEITVNPNSTALVETDDDEMSIKALEGETAIRVDNRIVPLVPGMTGIVPIQPFGANSGSVEIRIEPLNIDGLGNIPLGGLGRGITIPPPANDDSISTFNQFGDLIDAIGTDNLDAILDFLSEYNCEFSDSGSPENQCTTEQLNEIIQFLENNGYDTTELAQDNTTVATVFVGANVVSSSVLNSGCLGCVAPEPTPEPTPEEIVPIDVSVSDNDDNNPTVTQPQNNNQNETTPPPSNTQNNNNSSNNDDDDDDKSSGSGSSGSGSGGDSSGGGDSGSGSGGDSGGGGDSGSGSGGDSGGGGTGDDGPPTME